MRAINWILVGLVLFGFGSYKGPIKTYKDKGYAKEIYIDNMIKSQKNNTITVRIGRYFLKPSTRAATERYLLTNSFSRVCVSYSAADHDGIEDWELYFNDIPIQHTNIGYRHGKECVVDGMEVPTGAVGLVDLSCIDDAKKGVHVVKAMMKDYKENVTADSLLVELQ